MNFNSKQREFLKANIEKIKLMNKIELDIYVQKLFMAKYDMAKSVFEKVLEAVDIRIEELNNRADKMAVYATIEYED